MTLAMVGPAASGSAVVYDAWKSGQPSLTAGLSGVARYNQDELGEWSASALGQENPSIFEKAPLQIISPMWPATICG